MVMAELPTQLPTVVSGEKLFSGSLVFLGGKGGDDGLRSAGHCNSEGVGRQLLDRGIDHGGVDDDFGGWLGDELLDFLDNGGSQVGHGVDEGWVELDHGGDGSESERAQTDKHGVQLGGDRSAFGGVDFLCANEAESGVPTAALIFDFNVSTASYAGVLTINN